MRSRDRARLIRRRMTMKMWPLIVCIAFVTSAQAQTPYAGMQTRQIKALSEQQVADLGAGQGMGLALAAELNGYPGPVHVLELADALQLTGEQRHATHQLMQAHKAEARELGAQVLAAEGELDRAFAGRRIDDAEIARLTARIGELQGRLRAA